MTDLDPEIRASDADRERTVAVLKDHAAAGRLDTEELAARVDDAYSARTVGELSTVTADLPADRHARRQREQAAFRRQLIGFAIVNVGLIAIWAAGGGGSFWPIWPIIGWGMGIALQAARLRG